MSAKQDGAAVVGFGAAACAVCCAGPILGFLAAIGIGTAVGFALFGLVGLAIAVVIGLELYRRRQRRASACTRTPETVTLEAPKGSIISMTAFVLRALVAERAAPRRPTLFAVGVAAECKSEDNHHRISGLWAARTPGPGCANPPARTPHSASSDR